MVTESEIRVGFPLMLRTAPAMEALSVEGASDFLYRI